MVFPFDESFKELMKEYDKFMYDFIKEVENTFKDIETVSYRRKNERHQFNLRKR